MSRRRDKYIDDMPLIGVELLQDWLWSELCRLGRSSTSDENVHVRTAVLAWVLDISLERTINSESNHISHSSRNKSRGMLQNSKKLAWL